MKSVPTGAGGRLGLLCGLTVAVSFTRPVGELDEFERNWLKLVAFSFTVLYPFTALMQDTTLRWRIFFSLFSICWLWIWLGSGSMGAWTLASGFGIAAIMWLTYCVIRDLNEPRRYSWTHWSGALVAFGWALLFAAEFVTRAVFGG